MAFKRLKKIFSDSLSEDLGDDYMEIDLGQEQKVNKISVKLFTLKQYEEVNEILNALREGYTIAIIDIKILRKKIQLN